MAWIEKNHMEKCKTLLLINYQMLEFVKDSSEKLLCTTQHQHSMIRKVPLTTITQMH